MGNWNVNSYGDGGEEYVESACVRCDAVAKLDDGVLLSDMPTELHANILDGISRAAFAEVCDILLDPRGEIVERGLVLLYRLIRGVTQIPKLGMSVVYPAL